MVVLAASLGGTTWYSLTQLSGRIDAIQRNGVAGNAALANAQDAMWKLRYGIAQFVGTSDASARSKIVGESAAQFTQLDGAMESFAKTDLDAETRTAIEQFRAAFEPYKHDRPQWLSLMEQGKAEEAKDFRARTILLSGAASVKSLNRLLELQTKRTERDKLEAEREVRRALITMLGVGIPVTLLAIIFLGWVTRSTLKQLGGEPTYVREIVKQVAEGDLTVNIDLRVNDTDSMLSAIKGMVGKLSQIIGEVRGAANNLSNASAQVSTTAQSRRP